MHLARVLSFAFVFAAGAQAPSGAGAAVQARIARELERAAGLLASGGTGDDVWKQIQGDGQRALDLANAALRAGHPWLALQRAESALINLGSADYVRGIALAQRNDEAAFEAERARMGTVLADVLGDAPPWIATLRPAALRAEAEVAWLQARELYDASLEAARNTEARYGYFYVGQAKGARDLLLLCRALATESAANGDAEPPLRSLAPDVDLLEGELLAAYAPPRSLLLQGEFITTSDLLKQARELDGMGLRAGALLQLLQAAQFSARLRPAPAALNADALARALRDADERVTKSGRDGTLARLFLDAADAARTGPDANPATANTIVSDVLPRFFAALAPAAESASPVQPRATVTVVRWPFT